MQTANHLLTAAAFAPASTTAQARIVVSDPGFTGITQLSSPYSISSTAPVYGPWTGANLAGNWEIGGTAPDTYAFGNATNTANSRFLFQLIEDDKASTTSLSNDTESAWKNFSTIVDLGATGYDQITIGFGYVGLNSGNAQLQLDNVSVTAVPEPSTDALTGGLLALGAILVRRRRAASE